MDLQFGVFEFSLPHGLPFFLKISSGHCPVSPVQYSVKSQSLIDWRQACSGGRSFKKKMILSQKKNPKNNLWKVPDSYHSKDHLHI